MNVCVVGLWHLGTVTAACLARGGHDVVAVDFDAAVVEKLAGGEPPVFEPGLADLVRSGLDSGRLRFSTDDGAAASAEVVWVAYDTPVDDEDRADVKFVADRVARLFPHLSDDALVLISSQLPVGSTAALERAFASTGQGRRIGFGYSPENLRLGSAINVFTHPDRVVVGVRNERDRDKVARLLAPFTDRVEWMSVESAEMTKHALNAFLATSVTFINEIATLCEQVGADAFEVERGLKSESRIGPRAYLAPGGAFAGGTLARDIVFLSQLGVEHTVPTHLLAAVKTSNDAHRQWARRRLQKLLGTLDGRTVAVWGLTYKPGTDTTLPPDLVGMLSLEPSAVCALKGASALVVATPWPEYREIEPSTLIAAMQRPLVLDANRFLAGRFETVRRIEYLSVGKASA